MSLDLNDFSMLPLKIHSCGKFRSSSGVSEGYAPIVHLWELYERCTPKYTYIAGVLQEWYTWVEEMVSMIGKCNSHDKRPACHWPYHPHATGCTCHSSTKASTRRFESPSDLQVETLVLLWQVAPLYHPRSPFEVACDNILVCEKYCNSYIYCLCSGLDITTRVRLRRPTPWERVNSI